MLYTLNILDGFKLFSAIPNPFENTDSSGEIASTSYDVLHFSNCNHIEKTIVTCIFVSDGRTSRSCREALLIKV